MHSSSAIIQTLTQPVVVNSALNEHQQLGPVQVVVVGQYFSAHHVPPLYAHVCLKVMAHLALHIFYFLQLSVKTKTVWFGLYSAASSSMPSWRSSQSSSLSWRETALTEVCDYSCIKVVLPVHLFALTAPYRSLTVPHWSLTLLHVSLTVLYVSLTEPNNE